MLNSVGQRGRQLREGQASTRVDVPPSQIIATVALQHLPGRRRRRVEQAPIRRESSVSITSMPAIQNFDDGPFVAHEQSIRERRAVGTYQNMTRLGHAELLAEGEEMRSRVDLEAPSGMLCGQERLQLSY